MRPDEIVQLAVEYITNGIIPMPHELLPPSDVVVARAVELINSQERPFPQDLILPYQPPIAVTGIPTAGEAIRFFERLNYTNEHTWHESHGEGGQVTMQGPHQIWGQASCMIIAFNRQGQVTSIRHDRNAHDYRGARELRAQIEEDPGTAVLINESISACATAGTDVFYDGYRTIYSIFGAAGHGEWISRQDFDTEGDLLSSLSSNQLEIVYNWLKETRGYFSRWWRDNYKPN